jgi:PTH1 family peptidyl-tRNA hydrolase
MKAVIGLGNPGAQYIRTRHNAGFRVVDALTAGKGWSEEREKRSSLGGQTVRYRCSVKSGEWVAIKPLTFMNASGAAFVAALKDFGVEAADSLVILDDVSLPLGRLRLKPSGSSGGQKGLEDILNLAGTDQIARLRFGVGNDKMPPDLAAFVLAEFEREEEKVLEAAIDRAKDAVGVWAGSGMDEAMNRFN